MLYVILGYKSYIQQKNILQNDFLMWPFGWQHLLRCEFVINGSSHSIFHDLEMNVYSIGKGFTQIAIHDFSKDYLLMFISQL